MNHVVVAIFDKPRRLRFNVNAFADVEPLIGGSLFAVLANDAALLKFSVLRALIWAGLKHEDPELSISSVGDLMQKAIDSGNTVADFVRLVNDGVMASGLVKKAEEGVEDPPASGA